MTSRPSHPSRPSRLRRPGSVLVVDDDPEAREGTVDLVEQLGYGVFATATDGLAGLEATRFAALLFASEPTAPGELLPRLRALPGPRIPLLAILCDEAAACGLADVDEHLLRPLERTTLAACLARHIPAPEILDEGMLVTLRRFKLVAQLYPAFIAALPEQEASLRAAIAAGDREQVLQLAHRMRGTTAQMGAAALAQAFQAIEAMARSRRCATVPAPGDELTALISATITALTRELDAAP